MIIVKFRNYLEFYIKKIFNAESQNKIKGIRIGATNKKNSIPKIFWIFWNTNDLPYFVNICCKEVVRLHPEYEVRLLNFDGVKKYLPDLDFSYLSKLNIQNFSDLIRLKLLKKYGGIWMDASILFLQRIESIENYLVYKQNGFSNFFVYNPYYTTNIEFPIIENWIIGVEANNLFISEWCEEFEKCINSPRPNLFYKECENYQSLVQNIPENMQEYLFAFISAQYVLQKHTVGYFDLNILDCTDLGFQYANNPQKKEIDCRKSAKIMCINKYPKVPPIFIKQIAGGYWVNKLINEGLINNKSILGSLLKNYKTLKPY